MKLTLDELKELYFYADLRKEDCENTMRMQNDYSGYMMEEWKIADHLKEKLRIEIYKKMNYYEKEGE